MIAGFRPSPNFTLHASRGEHLDRRSVQQEMVDTYASVPSKSIPKVIPECVNGFVWMQSTNSIRPTLRKTLFISGA
jgi:hypothetical protein